MIQGRLLLYFYVAAEICYSSRHRPTPSALFGMIRLSFRLDRLTFDP